jgi:TPR repeat protein
MIAGVLAAGLFALVAAPAHANGGAGGVPPRPALKPLLLEPLVWDEACTPAHTRVEVPVGRMSARMREAWNLPQTADKAAWTEGALHLLARAYETGEMGLPQPEEAARIHCLLLRHAGNRTSAIFLSRLHARGAGVVFSPALADHFTRVAIGLPGDARSEEIMDFILDGVGIPNDDRSVRPRLRAARNWLREMSALPPARRHAVLRAYAPGGAGPRSDLLLADYYPSLGHTAALAGPAPEIVMPLARYAMSRLETGHPEAAALAHTFAFRAALHRTAREHRHAPAQSLLGRLLLTGTAHPKAPAAAYLWLSAARAQGYDDGLDLAVVAERISDAVKPGVCWYMVNDVLPEVIMTSADAERFRRWLLEEADFDTRCIDP